MRVLENTWKVADKDVRDGILGILGIRQDYMKNADYQDYVRES